MASHKRHHLGPPTSAAGSRASALPSHIGHWDREKVQPTVPNPRGSPLPTSQVFSPRPTCFKTVQLFVSHPAQSRRFVIAAFLWPQNSRLAHYLTQNVTFVEKGHPLPLHPAAFAQQQFTKTCGLQVEPPAAPFPLFLGDSQRLNPLLWPQFANN